MTLYESWRGSRCAWSEKDLLHRRWVVWLEDVNELSELRASYGYVGKKKIRTFLKARQLRFNITCKKSYEAALRESPRAVSTQHGRVLPCMAVNLS